MSDDSYDKIFVSIEDGAKPEQEFAPSRKVRVELTYFIAEDDNYQETLDLVGSRASSQVDILLGRVGAPTASAGVATQPPATRMRRTKEQIAADKAAEEAAKVAPPASDPTALEDPTELPQDAPQVSDATSTAASSGGEPTASTTVADPTALEDDFTVQPDPPKVETKPTQIAEISDGDLNAAVQKRNGELASADGTKAIRALIATYNPDPTKVFQLREIAADRRAEFLNGLNAIQPPAA